MTLDQLTRPLSVLRQIVAPTGRHRLRGPALVDQPALPAQAVLDEEELQRLLDLGELVATESARCPECRRDQAHAMHRDGSRTCWTCGTATPAGAQ
ncbi:hypothetical protein ACWDA7_38830 [Streptomyces sp. NPDC001156]